MNAPLTTAFQMQFVPFAVTVSVAWFTTSVSVAEVLATSLLSPE